jgi:hypothetical protein
MRRNLVKPGLTALATVGLLVGGATAASASTAPAPTGAETAINDGFAQLQGLVTGTLGIALFGIVIAILAITMGVKWLAKGASKN